MVDRCKRACRLRRLLAASRSTELTFDPLTFEPCRAHSSLSQDAGRISDSESAPQTALDVLGPWLWRVSGQSAAACKLELAAVLAARPLRGPRHRNHARQSILSLQAMLSSELGMSLTLRTNKGVMFRSGLRAALSPAACLPPAGFFASRGALPAAELPVLPLNSGLSCQKCPGGVPAGAIFSFSSMGLAARGDIDRAGGDGLLYTEKGSKPAELGWAACCMSEVEGRPILMAVLGCSNAVVGWAPGARRGAAGAKASRSSSSEAEASGCGSNVDVLAV